MNFYKNKNVLVTGGTGTIGIHVVEKLLNFGAKVRVVSLDDPSRASMLFGDKVEFIKCDLLDFKTCMDAAKGQEVVFNLVGIKGSTGIGLTKAASYYVPMLYFNTNMMEAAFRNKAGRYLFVSSVCVYPPAEVHYEDNAWNGMPKQNDLYAGIAKRAGEVQGETYLHEYKWDAVRVVRPSNVYGPHDDFNPASAQVIPALISRMLGGENPVKVWGDGTAVRDFIFAEDVAEGMMIALEKAPPCIPINLGSGSGSTIKEIAESVASCMPVTPKIEWDTTKPSGDRIRLLSTQRAQDLIGFKAKTSIRDGIKKTVEWFRNNSDSLKGRVTGLRSQWHA
ncbi:NAD-dependent epimerase/dehydratase family protein [Elusimicrobiota bacterium]